MYIYKLKRWVNQDKLEPSLSANVRAIEYLEKHKNLIDDEYIYKNENAIHIIEQIIIDDDMDVDVNCNKNAITFLRNNPEYIDYYTLCSFEHGIEFIDDLINNNMWDDLYWTEISKNPAAMHILRDEQYYEHISWHELIENKNACDMIRENLHKVSKYWFEISSKPYLMDLIEENMDNISWYGLSLNSKAIHILKNNTDKIMIDNLCENENGFELLLLLNHEFSNEIIYHEKIMFEYFDYCEKNNLPFVCIDMLSEHGYTDEHMQYLIDNHEQIDYHYLSKNPNIFEYNYKRMRKTRQSLPWYNEIKK